jgi:LAO/AO transport system kinase
VTDLAAGVLSGDRAAIARAITLVESRRADHRERAQQLLVDLLPRTGGSMRVGITGVPGVGKSTLIDRLGADLIGRGSRVAVLAVDPSSARSGGSILGDKTRMVRLAASENAFVRPSPSAGTLGGVAKATRETMLVMEAAGFDVVLVETVGVGQSEYVVAEMVDTFVYLTLPRTGDALQGIKRGILELADVVGINKADGDSVDAARRAAGELAAALRLLRGGADDWQPPVVACSAVTDGGLDRLWGEVERHREWLRQHGRLEDKRRQQLVHWTRALVRERLLARLDDPEIRSVAAHVEQKVLDEAMTPAQAADRILKAVDRLS